VPGEKHRVDLAQEGGSLRSRPPVAGGFPDPLSGYGMGWWLVQAAGVGRRRRSVGGSRGAGPVIGAGEVALRRGRGVGTTERSCGAGRVGLLHTVEGAQDGAVD
jgi:hypothetical protein